MDDGLDAALAGEGSLSGRVLRTDTLTFPPLKSGESWSVLRTRTGSSIMFRSCMALPSSV